MTPHQILNIVRREVLRVVAIFANTRVGIVQSYDPASYSCTVLIQPEGTLTGFLPITTEWVGNGWGFFCPPTKGDVVEVNFQENGKNAGFIGKRFYSSVTVPLSVQSGELWLVHKTGSFIKITNDGKISIKTISDLVATVGGNLNATIAGTTNITSTGNTTITTPNLIVNGNIIATGDITDQSSTTDQSMRQQRAIYDSHTHPGVQGGPSNTGTPNQIE